MLRVVVTLLRALALLIVLALIIAFAVENRAVIDVSLPFIQEPLRLPGYVLAATGIVCGLLLGIGSAMLHYQPRLWRSASELRRLRREHDALRGQCDAQAVESQAREAISRQIAAPSSS